MADQKKFIDDLVAKSKLPRQDVENYVNLAARFASKAVLTVLKATIEAGPALGFSAQTAADLVKKIVFPYQDSGFISIEIRGQKERLNIATTICKKTTVLPNIDLPQEAAKDLYQQYQFLKETARGYWVQFCRSNSAFFDEIQRYRSDVNFIELKIDETSPRTLYFDPECMTRVAVFAYWVNADGVPLQLLNKK